MSDDRTFERDAQEWLELGPRRAPAGAVQKALQIIDTTPQQRDLRILWRFPQLNVNKRLAIAAAVGLLVVGAGLLILRSPQSLIGGQSPSPTGSPSPSPISLDQLQGAWASVGTRDDPIGNHANPPQVEAMAIDAAGLRINTFKGDVFSSLSEANGTFTMQMNAPQDMLTRQSWDCTTGDTGTYFASLTPDKQTLTLSSTSDACTTRSDILAGAWTRWPCPNPDQYAYCNHVSELAPGRYVAPLFRPFQWSSTGQLAYTVGAGWADLKQPPTWPALEAPSDISLTRVDAPDSQAISIYSNLKPSSEIAVPDSPNPTCNAGTPAPAFGSAEQVADFLATLPYLSISGRTPVTLSGLSGIQIDASLVNGFIDPCSSGSTDGGPTVYSTEISLFESRDHQSADIWLDPDGTRLLRLILLDSENAPQMKQVVILIGASDQATLDARIAIGMPVIQSFEFLP